MIDYEKLRSDLLNHLDYLSDEELIEKLKKCGLQLEEIEEIENIDLEV